MSKYRNKHMKIQFKFNKNQRGSPSREDLYPEIYFLGSLFRGGVSVQGGSDQGVSVWGGSLSIRVLCPRCLCSEGGLCPGISVQGGLCPGGLCPGGLCPGVSVQEGLCLGGSLSIGVLCPGCLCSDGSLSRGSLSRGSLCPDGSLFPGGDPMESEERVVRILLECFLVVNYLIRQNINF